MCELLLLHFFCFFFFFSSRRRHTRLQGDWSSDVCSSDLLLALVLRRVPGVAGHAGRVPIRRRDRVQTLPMRASDAANRPRWSGQAGFFEIWFLVVFEAAARRAWWVRYTTFPPAPGLQPGVARATPWAAAFDARAPEPAIAVKHIFGAEDYHAGAPGRFAIRLGSAELRNDACRGEVESRGPPIP